MKDYEGKMLVKEDVVEIVGKQSPSIELSSRDEVRNVERVVFR
jgi:hypothetical protein